MHVRNIVEPKGIGRPPLEHANDKTKTTSILDQLLCCALLNDLKPPNSASIHAPQTNISRAGSDLGRRSQLIPHWIRVPRSGREDKCVFPCV